MAGPSPQQPLTHHVPRLLCLCCAISCLYRCCAPLYVRSSAMPARTATCAQRWSAAGRHTHAMSCTGTWSNGQKHLVHDRVATHRRHPQLVTAAVDIPQPLRHPRLGGRSRLRGQHAGRRRLSGCCGRITWSTLVPQRCRRALDHLIVHVPQHLPVPVHMRVLVSAALSTATHRKVTHWASDTTPDKIVR